MANQNEGGDCDATSSPEWRFKTVFIDTNLDTHLAMIVSPSDTVLDFKKKIMSEHPECFPKYGKIEINALKVKRKGFLYHLSDSMFVKSAFEGAKRCWFLSADACSIKQANENQIRDMIEGASQLALIHVTKITSGDSSNHEANNSSNKVNDNCGPSNICNDVQKDLEMEVENAVLDPCSRVFPDSNWVLDYSSKNQEQLNERHVVSETNAIYKGRESQVGVDDYQSCNPPEGSIRNEPVVKKKQKSKTDETTISNITVRDDDEDIYGHSSGKTVTEIPKDMERENVDAGNIVSNANSDQQGDDSEVSLDANQSNNPRKASLRSGYGANKKHSKKKTEDLVSNCILEDDDVDSDKHLSDNKVREALVDVEMLNIDVVKEPYGTSLDDTDLRSDIEEIITTPVETRDNLSKNLVSNALLEQASKSVPSSKKRKIKRREGASNSLEESNNITSTKSAKAPMSSVIVGQQNTTASTENLITESPEDVDLVDGTSSRKRRSKQKRSSRGQKLFPALPSQIPGEEGFEEDVKTVAMSVDKENAENMGNDIGKASNSAIVSESDVHLAIPYTAVDVDNLNEFPPPAVTELGKMKADVVLSTSADFLRDHHHVTINGPDKMKEQKESPLNHEIKEMVLQKVEEPIQSGIDGQSKEAVGSTNTSETNINMEPGKYVGSKKLKKRVKKPVSAEAVVPSVGYGDNYASDLSTTTTHYCSAEAKKMLSPLSWAKTAGPNFFDTSSIAANRGVNNRLCRSDEECLPLPEVNTTQENAEIVQKNVAKEAETNSHVKEKENKLNFPPLNVIGMTPKKTEITAAKPTNGTKQNQNSTGETQSASAVKVKKVGAEELSSSKYRSGEVENASKAKNKRKRGKSSSKNQSTEKDLEPKKNIGDGHGSLTLGVYSHKGNSIERSLDIVDGGSLNNYNVSNANHPMDVSKSKDDEIDFKDYLSPRDTDHEVLPGEPVVDAVQELKRSGVTVKVKKRMEVSMENGSERTSHPKTSTVIEHKDVKKLSTNKEIERKASLGNSHPTIAKSSTRRMGEYVNSSQREKSLLATPGSIFWDNSSEVSEDSDSSTKAPSDNSSSSSDSEEKGADGAKGADDGRIKKEIITPHSKRINMDVILRRSSIFKKAKLSAAQFQLEDTESQSVDFVPDSQPNQLQVECIST